MATIDCVNCYYRTFVQDQQSHLGCVLALGVYLTAAIYFVVYRFLVHHLSPSWIAGLYACWVLGNIMLREPTFSAFTLLYDYHVRTRVCGIHWPKENNVPLFLCTSCGFLGIILWYHSGSEEASTWTIIGCILVMLVVILWFCYDPFKGLQAWKTTNKKFKRLQLVKVESSQQIVVLFSSNASNQFRINSKEVLETSQFDAVTEPTDLTKAQSFMTHHINTNATHDWIVNRQRIIECITGTIKDFDLKTPWEWIIWIRDSIWSWFPSMAGCLEGISQTKFVAVVLGCCAVFYARRCNMRQSDGVVNYNYDCNSDWHTAEAIETYCRGHDSREFFEQHGFDKDDWFYPCVFHWIEIFVTSGAYGPFLLMIGLNKAHLFVSRPPKPPPKPSA